MVMFIAHKLPVALKWVVFFIQIAAFLWIFGRWGGGV
jgi:hypothetical protein